MKLSNEELNEKLARALGWTNCDVIKTAVVNGKKGVYRHSCRDPKGVPQLGIPDFSGDLNACHEAVQDLSEYWMAEYRTRLCRAMHALGPEGKMQEAIDAPAGERAIALLTTLEIKEKA